MIPLGRGPVAEVFAADGSAVKVFPGKFDRRTLAAIEREKAKLDKLSAPILAVDGIGQVGDKSALRMELCVESLASRVRREGDLPLPDVVALGAALSSALAAAHGAGILHGGVSPENVLFRASGQPVLADFGVPLRQAFRRDPLHGIEWVSPETLRTGAVDERTDLYGLGAVLHFALTGESPHPSRIGEQTGERILRVLSAPVPAISRPDVTIGLSTVIGRLLALEPANRKDAKWAAEELAAMHPHSATVTLTPPPRKSSRRWYVAAGAAALALVLGVVLWPRNGSVTPPAVAATTTPVVTELNLADPTDLGDQVVLNWTTDDDSLYFGVVVTPEGEPNDTLSAERNRTMRVPVDPKRKYCFQIRGANGDKYVVSQVKGVREAVCRK
jgi:eukaryotic-like serine/threonine-protein kinase